MAEAHKKTVKKTAAPKAKAPAPKKKKVVEAPEVKKVETKVPASVSKPEARPAVSLVPAAEAKKVFVEPKPRLKPALPDGQKYYGTGRRKEATAKVWLMPGTGKMTVNGKTFKEYFCNRHLLEFIASRPFAATQTTGKYDVFAELLGGGVPSQADAIRMGIARALVVLNPALKPVLKKEGLMTRDPRMKERKKYGLKRARRAFQYTKR
jgi:small subunit ribosomal protein S9